MVAAVIPLAGYALLAEGNPFDIRWTRTALVSAAYLALTQVGFDADLWLVRGIMFGAGAGMACFFSAFRVWLANGGRLADHVDRAVRLLPPGP